ncbi:unnamed protein product (macronuclear) [Paramecium tetraurelia]|uniref:Uncharacterized protein n=1 Tax=Paramecium tetraurelia TaxID=5888 RepID=A0E5B2_PARTE|nr:uncharacterized protein GSPATT00023656001 [Paramecium tetraurelia]CAK90479.1 unnamed protein product [Paramecium tetraurelia]|eukprot:XP_001457876.1 hypothetical protein (macronuclear) [Paramecium tetraurelia strain d4-2]
MGATCKFRERDRDRDVLLYNSNSNLANQSQYLDNKLNQKYRMCSKSNKSRNATNSPITIERPHFFIIYPKNENQLNDLVLQLQNLNRNNNYFIEEYSQMTSQQEESKYESNFALEGISEGSFNVFRI